MEIAILFAISAAALLTTSVQSVSVSEFTCGVDKLTTFAAYKMVSRTCRAAQLHPVNECCRAHDRCYDQQMGQGYCDKTFCDCLNSQPSAGIKCKATRIGMCQAVKAFGHHAYKNAGSKKPKLGSIEDIPFRENY
ncbi:hypothetical protein QR680_003984 [Steinernema hermaphroditum]|uniref:Phospholipase A2 domain-containing protein n=1 Tax=Steinernema hermaphroditum TaxID=289476 RepID=A0AA39HPH6_9BILA|nr:hypothetical protein QR680_003984 [Steinernema hermaphroditum]